MADHAELEHLYFTDGHKLENIERNRPILIKCIAADDKLGVGGVL